MVIRVVMALSVLWSALVGVRLVAVALSYGNGISFVGTALVVFVVVV